VVRRCRAPTRTVKAYGHLHTTPYFPQGSLAPPNKNRYRKFKVVMALAVLVVLLLLAGAGIAGSGISSRVRTRIRPPALDTSSERPV
jgi:hypothetical protein